MIRVAQIKAMIDAGHPMVPFGGETENGFRKFCGAKASEGLLCSSAGTGPAQVAVAIKFELKRDDQTFRIRLIERHTPATLQVTLHKRAHAIFHRGDFRGALARALALAI